MRLPVIGRRLLLRAAALCPTLAMAAAAAAGPQVRGLLAAAPSQAILKTIST